MGDSMMPRVIRKAPETENTWLFRRLSRLP